MRKIAIFLVLTGLFFACNNEAEVIDAVSDQDSRISSYLNQNGISDFERITTSGGEIYYSYRINESTTNNPQAPSQNSVVTFTYAVELLDGTVIAAAGSSPQIIAKVGVDAIFPTGIDLALQDSDIRAGDTFQYIFTSGLAYGPTAIEGLFPENSPMIITINLISVENEQEVLARKSAEITAYISDNNLNDTSLVPALPVRQFQNGGVSIKTTSLGSGLIPTNGSTITFTYDLSYLDGTPIASVGVNDQIQYVVGGSIGGQGASLVTGLESALSQMRVGERALAILAPQVAYLESAQVIPVFLKDEMVENNVIPAYAESVDPYSILLFDVILRSVN